MDLKRFTLLATLAVLAAGTGCNGNVDAGNEVDGDALSATGLRGEYFDNPDFTSSKLVRTDATLDFDWASGSPASTLGADTFSVRWTGTLTPLYTETYTLSTQSDDGIRVYVDGVAVINHWNDHGVATDTGTVSLTKGHAHAIKVEYYENGGLAVAKLSWQSAHQAKQIIPASAFSPSAACPASAVFCDDFSGAAPVTYQTHDGTWTRKTGSEAVTDGTAWQRAVSVLPTAYGDFDFTVKGSTLGDSGLGITYGSSLADDGYAVIVHPAQFQGVYLKQLIPGQADREIQHASIASGLAGTSLTVRVTRKGSTVTVYLNGTQQLSADDGSGGKAGKLGALLSETDQLTNSGASFTLLRLDSTSGGTGPVDAGTPPADAGTPAHDAGTPPPPPVDAGTPPTGGTLSGLAWPSGASAEDYGAFASWRGRALDWYITWPNRGNWTELENPDIYGAISQFAGLKGKVSIGIAMLPEDGSSNFATCASGAYDQHYKNVGSKLVALGRGDSDIRLGWEANGDWYAWSIGTDVTNYVNCFRKEAAALRATAPNLKIDWNMNKDSHMSSSVADAYPGDAYVDVIGVDFYDAWPAYPNETAWDSDYSSTQNGGPRGLGAWLAFAKAHGKKFSLPEWGLQNDGGGGGGFDNPFYIQKMHDFFAANASEMSYEAIFNEQSAAFIIYPAGSNPNASAKYKSLF